MKITIYELLGLIKDDKAPKKIKIGNKELYFSKTKNTYVFEDSGNLNWSYYVTDDSLDSKVTVIEDDDFEDIKEVVVPEIDDVKNTRTVALEIRINKLIRNQKKIISKLENNEE